jgi:hypothetical protein
MKRTAEEVCIEYARAAEAVREQTRIILNNRCTVADSPSERSYTEGTMTPCWQDIGLEDREDWCEECVAKDAAKTLRAQLRKRLRAAKRSVEAVGKRLMKEGSL